MAENEKIFLLAPLHIKRREDIADIFGVAPETVTEWAKEGAPIVKLRGEKIYAEAGYWSIAVFAPGGPRGLTA